MRLARTIDWESRRKDKQFSNVMSRIWSKAAFAERELVQAVNDLGKPELRERKELLGVCIGKTLGDLIRQDTNATAATRREEG